MEPKYPLDLISTSDLCEELETRDGVEMITVGGIDSNAIIKTDGPVTIFIVTD